MDRCNLSIIEEKGTTTSVEKQKKKICFWEREFILGIGKTIDK
jgi:hypothetical protein